MGGLGLTGSISVLANLTLEHGEGDTGAGGLVLAGNYLTGPIPAPLVKQLQVLASYPRSTCELQHKSFPSNNLGCPATAGLPTACSYC